MLGTARGLTLRCPGGRNHGSWEPLQVHFFYSHQPPRHSRCAEQIPVSTNTLTFIVLLYL